MTTEIETVSVKACTLNLGEIHRPIDIGFFHPIFHCVTRNGEQFTATMRLHVTEPLNSLLIADPRAFPDGGLAINAAGSRALRRRQSYTEPEYDGDPGLRAEELHGARVFRIPEEEIRRAVLNSYDHATVRASASTPGAIAFTCHDPGVIGGGNTILFRFINWLADLGVRVTVYSCGRYPYWTPVRARFRLFKTYRQMCAAIEEDTVVLFSMWHIEPMLQAHRPGMHLVHLRQIYEPYHYGTDYASMLARKPVIELLESLPIGVITVSPHLRDWYEQRHGLVSVLVTNGISPYAYFPGWESSNRNNFCRVVSVGDPRHFVKGADVLARALQLLAARKPQLTIEWTIASGSPAKLGTKDMKFPSNLTLTTTSGLTPVQMRKLYQTATLVVNPSLYEGFGLPTLESMACGVPVVHADNRGLDTIVVHEKNCLMVPVNDPPALATAIERLSADRHLAARISAAGVETARQHTTLQQFEDAVPAFERILGLQFAPDAAAGVRQQLEAHSSPRDGQPFTPLVSVVIPSYNQAGYLRQALDSLLAQTYTNWEAVVVNDGSTDTTADVMAEYAAKDPRIRPISKPNGGITSALNAGLENARGEFFCWLSSDDLFYPRKLAWQVQAFEELEDSYAMVYGSFDILEEETGQVNELPFQDPLTPGAEFPEALKFDFVDGCTIMIRMQVMREVGGFNGYYRHSQDMELWIRIASRGYRFQQLKRKLTLRRVHAAQSSTGNMIHCRYDAAWMINYYLEHFHLLEMYRYFDLSSADGLNLMLGHLVGRMKHTEANVNHPLLQEKFWLWIKRGISALPAEEQRRALGGLMKHLLQGRQATSQMEYYVTACADALSGSMKEEPYDPVYTVEGRDIRRDDRENDTFGNALFDYGCDLLVNAHTPLFAQELYFHNTNKVVDTPYKLAHSVFRYLSQFPNQYRERVRPFAALKDTPSTAREALDLFCRLRYPALAGALHASMLSAEDGSAVVEGLDPAEEQIAAMSIEEEDDLRRVCQKNPTETLLFYWLALAEASKGRFSEALDLGWRTMTVGHRNCNWRIAMRLGEWAEQACDFEKAYVAYTMAEGIPAAAEATRKVLRRIVNARVHAAKRQPVPQGFIGTRDGHRMPEAELTHCAVIPRQNGKYDLACWAKGEDKSEFYAIARLPYSPDFEPQVISNPATGTAYKITAGTLFRLWSGGYDFERETHRYLSGLLRDTASPRVAFTVLNGSTMGGGTRVLYRFVEWLEELGVKVDVYSNDAAPAWTDVRGTYHHIADPAERYAAIIAPVVLVYSVLEMPQILRFCKTGGKRILHFSQVVEDFNYYGSTVESLMAPKAIMQILQSLPVGRVAISAHIRDYFRERYQQESYLVVNGIDRFTWKPGPVPPATSEKTILTAGNPTRLIKGATDLRQAVALLARKHPEWKIRLAIVSGEHVHGYPVDTTSLGFTTSLHCGLSSDEMRDRYLEADVYVNAAWYEGFGLPSIEAMSCGVPVIQADNRGLDTIIRKGQNCLVVKPGMPREIADNLERIFTDDGLRRRLIEEGKRTASAVDLAGQFEMFVPVFEDLLSHRFDRSAVSSVRHTLKHGSNDQRVREAVSHTTPLFSVLVPVYNQADLLPAALDSLIEQLYPNWEAVVVNDGSTDDTAAVLEYYAGRDSRIKPYHKTNGGTGSALNYALRHARGEWICWLSSDDLFRAEKLQLHAAEIARHPEVKFYHTHYYTLEGENGKLTEFNPGLPSAIPPSDDRVISLLRTNYLNGISVCIHHTVFDEVGGFDESYRWGQDYDMWLRVAARWAPRFIPARTCVTRVHAGQDSRGFPEAGIFDSARSTVAFLNRHPFGELFPEYALQEQTQIVSAVQKTLSVAAYPLSYLNQFGCTRALIDRLHEWLSQSCPLLLRSAVYAQIVRVIDTAQASSAEPSIKAAFASLRNAGSDQFTYTPVDPLVEAEEYACECEHIGKSGKAAVIRKYLEKAGRNRQPSGKPEESSPVHMIPAAHTATAAKNRPLSVTYLINSILGITGGNQTLLQQANELVRRGHTVNIVTYSDKPAWFEVLAHVIKVPEGQPFAPSVPPSDVVISTYFLNTPQLQHIQATAKIYFAQGDQFLFEDVLRHPDPAVDRMIRQFAELSRASYMYTDVHVVANSETLARRVEKKYGRRADAVLPVCIDHATFHPLQRSATPPCRILVVGPDIEGSALEPLHFKGMHDVKDALGMLAAESSSFTVVRISNSERSIFKDVPCEFYVAPSAELKTFLYGTAHILVYASHYESWGLPPLEAMAAGAAVVCTATEAASEYCRHGENALLVPPRSPASLANAVRRLMQDTTLRQKLMEGGFATARRFRKEQEWDELEAILYRLVIGSEGGEMPVNVKSQDLACALEISEGTLAECHELFSAKRFAEACRKAHQVEGELQQPGDTQLSLLENLRLFRGWCFLEMEDLDGAKEAFQAALEASPSSGAACTGLGTVFMRAGEPGAAKTMFEWGVRNDPESQQAASGLVDANRALGLPEAHSSMDENPPSPPGRSIKTVLEEAYCLFGERKFEEALRAVDSAQELIDPALSEDDHGTVFACIENFRGHVYLALSDLESAKRHFENGLRADSQSSQACAGLGEVFHLSGNHPAAKTMYEWAVQCDPGNASAVNGLAKVNAGLGFPENDNTLLKSETVQAPENA